MFTLCLQSLQWCEDGIFLLASQPVDRCQSQDGAEAALQELERYLDTAPLHILTECSAICSQYEAVLTDHLRVSGNQDLFQLEVKLPKFSNQYKMKVLYTTES